MKPEKRRKIEEVCSWIKEKESNKYPIAPGIVEYKDAMWKFYCEILSK